MRLRSGRSVLRVGFDLRLMPRVEVRLPFRVGHGRGGGGCGRGRGDRGCCNRHACAPRILRAGWGGCLVSADVTARFPKILHNDNRRPREGRRLRLRLRLRLTSGG